MVSLFLFILPQITTGMTISQENLCSHLSCSALPNVNDFLIKVGQ